MTMQDGKNNKWISSRYWWLLLPLITACSGRDDNRQQAGLYSVKQGVGGDQGIFQEEFNISSRLFDGYPRCASIFYERNFFFSSANYPQNYEHNSDCIFTVKRSDGVCSLQLVFQTFYLEESDECLLDYLEINGQKLCGLLSPNTQRVYPFIGSEIVIRFSTNAVISNRGFFIRGSQVTCGQESVDHYEGSSKAHNCDQTFHQMQFNVTSPNYPTAYGNDLGCTYTIKKSWSNICKLQITFVSLDLQESVGDVGECLNDFLEMDHQRLCYLPTGSIRTVEFMEDAYCIRFRSGNGRRSTCARFLLNIRQLPCSTVSPTAFPDHGQFCSLGFEHRGHGLSTSTDDLHFQIRSPGFPLPYTPNQDCLFIVRKAPARICSLQMVVEVFDVDQSPGCFHDFLSIGNEKLCGMMQKGSKRNFEFVGDEIHIRFLSNGSRSKSGFLLTFWQKGCFFPAIQTTPWPPTPQPNHNCDVVYKFRDFEITSPFTNSFGPFSSICTYTIIRQQNPDSCALALEILEFDFGNVDGIKIDECEQAFLEINGERLCQNGLRGTNRKYSFDKNTFLVRFFSGSAHQPRFRILGTQLPCTITPQDPYPYPGNSNYPYPVIPNYPYPAIPNYPYPSPHIPHPSPCNCTYQQEEFLITSGPPSWPSKSSTCVFFICKARLDICSLDVVFERFDLQNTPGCVGESLVVDNQRYCGNIPMGTVRRHEFRNDFLRINLYWCSGVFLLRFRQIPCTVPYPITPPPPLIKCDSVQSEPEFHWTSPNYPQPYDSNRDCRLIIQKYDTIVCEVLITFNHFDLEQTVNCQQDFLEIRGNRFCGHIAGGTQRILPFNASSLIIGFHSGQNYNNRGGFDVVFKQQLCFDGPIFRRSGIDIDQNLNLSINDEGHSLSPMAHGASEKVFEFTSETNKNLSGAQKNLTVPLIY